MHLFDASAFAGDKRTIERALDEALAEVAATKASLRTAIEREGVWQRRCALLEAQLRRCR